MPESILEQARSEGYNDGLGQASQVRHDEAYYHGFLEGRRAAPTAQWFVWGLLIGALMGYFTGIFVS